MKSNLIYIIVVRFAKVCFTIFFFSPNTTICWLKNTIKLTRNSVKSFIFFLISLWSIQFLIVYFLLVVADERKQKRKEQQQLQKNQLQQQQPSQMSQLPPKPPTLQPGQLTPQPSPQASGMRPGLVSVRPGLSHSHFPPSSSAGKISVMYLIGCSVMFVTFPFFLERNWVIVETSFLNAMTLFCLYRCTK